MKDISGLYLITDESLINKEDYFAIIDSVLIHRPKFIQLRAKDIDKKEILFKAKKIREISNKYNVKFIVNDYLDVAIDSQADGIHIGQSDEDYLNIKKEIGKDKIIGVSCYGDIERCIKFSELGADYIAIGTPYFTKTKPSREKTPFSKMKEIVDRVQNTPIFAIGGIDGTNIDSIMDVGVNGVAVINSVFGSSTPSTSTLELINILNKRI
ncbi:thiamine phosphate synthase [bacterium]|nr:thiamine phosphate synthase [bacterium]|tara:strand:+ start:4981 stop:5613 length:633 start_codon:yes stop_codon:yes gene_type:complete